MSALVSIPLDLLLICRVLAAFSFGCGLAAGLQFTRLGRFLAEERTWLTVVLGVGVDLMLAYQADWMTTVGVFAMSSVGVIVRSLLYEHQETVNLRSYKLIHHIEDATALALDITATTTKRLSSAGVSSAEVIHLARILTLTNGILDHLKAARSNQ